MHQQSVCVLRMIDCEFKHHGCTARILVRDITTHQRNAALEHVALLSRAVTYLGATVHEYKATMDTLADLVPKVNQLAKRQRTIDMVLRQPRCPLVGVGSDGKCLLLAMDEAHAVEYDHSIIFTPRQVTTITFIRSHCYDVTLGIPILDE
jgi:hypothetical protein